MRPLLAVVATAAAIHTAPAPFELPAPTGRHAVGTTTWRVIDPARRETLSTSSPAVERRTVEVLAWYPAGALRRRAPASYLREGLIEVRTFAKLLRAPEQVFDDLAGIVTHAETDAAMVAQPGRLPLLVFSHGYTGLPSSYTALLEDLASHGYVVLGVVHPYESAAATMGDGQVVTMLEETGAPILPLRQVFEEWRSEDEQMARVTQTPDLAGQREILRAYISSVPRTNEVVRRWVADTKLVLDQLPARIAARVDRGRVGAFGHSMGGVAAGQFCLDDRRCRGALNLDGIPQSGDMLDRTMPHPFLMVYSARPGRLGASDAIYRRAARR
jgi:dienelactone hydrolase